MPGPVVQPARPGGAAAATGLQLPGGGGAAAAKRPEVGPGGPEHHNIRACAAGCCGNGLLCAAAGRAGFSFGAAAAACRPSRRQRSLGEPRREQLRLLGKLMRGLEGDRAKKSSSAASPGQQSAAQPAPCVNPGNPVFSCMLDPKALSTATSLSKPKMIMYKTQSSYYGECSSLPQFFPCVFTPKEQVFSSHLKATGFYQNNTLNTSSDKTRTLDFPNFQHTL
ncbi:piercer of microtubule wall 2 protein [Erinaceus europaeus]|uniref:Piercer of microtubule wall 2 protein n=1 Tax=Erinaceus europaeus TaxID=9365 RepID=A0ABM3WCC5_ERIEU|nr:piercer of microtubule wall 2 protein [Erinaceus europaeus]